MANQNITPGVYTCEVAIGSLTGSDSTEVAVFAAPVRCKVLAVNLVNGAALTAHADNYGTLTCYNKGTAGNGTTSVAARAHTAGNGASAFVPWPLTLSATPASLTLAEGNVLTAKWTEAGTGSDLTAAVVQVVWTPHSGLD